MATIMSEFEVLIVDDEPADVRLLQMALRQGDYPCSVAVAGNGAEALDLLRIRSDEGRTGPDLILLDLNMPRMNGREFLQSIKADAALRLTPVVVVSTSDAERDVTAAYELGAAGYLSKPVDIDELFADVRRVTDYWFGVMRLPPRQ